MTKYTYKLAGILGIILCAIASCKKFVRIDPPDSEIVTASVFNSSGTATAAITSIYSQMKGDSYFMSSYCGLLADELNDSFSTDPTLNSYYSNAMSASVTSGAWNNAYSYIYQTNAILEALNGNTAITPAIIQQLQGESKFLRAFWYFYLVNCYGDIPLATTTNYKINSLLSRSTRDKVYQQIVSDLKDAESLLNSNYVDGSDTAITGARIRPTKWAAMALLARTYLFMGDYASAESESDSVIGNTGMYNIVDSLGQVFLANSREAIWQLGIPTPTSINTYDGWSFILIATPGSGTSNTLTISNRLLNNFEMGDKRMTNWIGAYTTTSAPFTTYYFPYKYQVYQSSNVTENVMMLRLAEQYLIRAEAKIQQRHDIIGAIADINTIRHRAGLTDYSGGTDKLSLLTEVLHQRQDELFTEWGHRWFDLIRTQSADSVMSIVTPSKGGAWDAHCKLFPIPQPERNIDINLSQNPGY